MRPALLFLHAFPLDATMWRPQVEAVHRAHPDLITVAPSLPGFGGTPAPGPVLTTDQAADAAALALDRVGAWRAVVVGLSMGGYIALAMWRRHRDRVAGLVLANTRAVADDEAGKEKRRALAERLSREGSAFLVESPPALLSPNAPAELQEQVKATIAAQPAAAIAAASLGMADRPDSTADLDSIDVPALVITSSADTLIPPDASLAMADRIPRAQRVVIPDVGHLSNLEAPDAFNAALLAFLPTIPG